MTTQLITPNPDIPCQPGWCLQYVREAFSLPARYGSATEAWNNSPSKHQDWDFPPGCWVPVWFAIDVEPNGHVALLAPDGSVFSSSDLTNVPHHHPNMADLIDYYARWGKMTLTYLGWSEDVAGYPVVSSDTGSINVDSISTPQEDDMPLTNADIELLLNYQVTQPDGNKNTLGELIAEERGHHLDVLNTINDRAAAVVSAIFNTPVPNATGGVTSLGALIGWNDAHVNAIIDAAKSGGKFDPAAVQKAVSNALAQGVKVNITTN